MRCEVYGGRDEAGQDHGMVPAMDPKVRDTEW